MEDTKKKRRRNRRRTIITHKHVQLRFGILIALILFFVCLVTGWSVYFVACSTFLEYFSEAPAVGKFAEVLAEIDSSLRGWVILITILGTALALIAGIFFSHRVVGPLYRLERVLRMVGENRNFSSIRFRKGDFLSTLADSFNYMIDKLKNREIRLAKNLREVSKQLKESKISSPQAASKIEEISKELDIKE